MPFQCINLRLSPRYIKGYGGKLAPAKTLEGLMAALDTYLKTRQQRLQQVFDEVDADGNGHLDPREFARLMRAGPML